MVKAQKSHIFALGVGAAVTKPKRPPADGGFRIRPIPGEPIRQVRLHPREGFRQARGGTAPDRPRTLSGLGHRHQDGGRGRRGLPARPRVEIHRLDLDNPGAILAAAGSSPSDTGPRTETTNKKGVATFQWNPSNAGATSTVTLDEELKTGTRTWTPSARQSRHQNGHGSRPPCAEDSMPSGECHRSQPVREMHREGNRIRPGTIEIEKSATPRARRYSSFTRSPAW